MMHHGEKHGYTLRKKWFARFRQKSSRIIFTIPNFWAPAYVFLNDYTHINNQSLRTWVYWLRRAGFVDTTYAHLGDAKKVPVISKINHFLGRNGPGRSLIISASLTKV